MYAVRNPVIFTNHFYICVLMLNLFLIFLKNLNNILLLFRILYNQCKIEFKKSLICDFLYFKFRKEITVKRL